MKRVYSLLAVVVLAASLVACTAVQAAPPATATPLQDEPPRAITVVGMGKVSLVPDIARIHVGAEVRADTVAEAKAEVDRQIAAIMAALSALGVQPKDIQTNQYSIHYQQEPTPMMGEAAEETRRDGYRVSNMLQVTVRDVERAGAVLDAVVEAGANQVYGVSFTVSDEAEWESQAREKAVADAVVRAGELAELTDLELGEVLSVSEVIGGMWTGPRQIMWESGMGGGGGLAPGELEMGTQVQVVFAVQ